MTIFFPNSGDSADVWHFIVPGAIKHDEVCPIIGADSGQVYQRLEDVAHCSGAVDLPASSIQHFGCFQREVCFIKCAELFERLGDTAGDAFD